MRKIKDAFEMYITFFMIGLVTFGGGLAILGMYEEEFVKKRKWLTSDELINYYATSQSIPGIIIVNTAGFIGCKKAGIIGIIASILGVITPSIFVITVVAMYMKNINEYPLMQKFLKGINISVAAVLMVMAYDIVRKSIKNVSSIVFALISFILVYFFNLSVLYIIIGGIVIINAWLYIRGNGGINGDN